MKRYTLFAGVNGAGKSTLYYSTFMSFLGEQRINTDEMVMRLGSWEDSNLQTYCARNATKLIAMYLDKGITFNQETTLTGRSILQNIKRAKESGFEVHIYYIGLCSAGLAIERVGKRVSNGGHGIAVNDIKRRYKQSFENLVEIISFCDRVTLLDNSLNLKTVATYVKGQLLYEVEKPPSWFIENVKAYL